MNRRTRQNVCAVLVWTWAMTRTLGKSITTEYPIATTNPLALTTDHSLTRYELGLEDYDEEQERLGAEQGQDAAIYGDHEPVQDHDHDPMTSGKAMRTDPWQGYYEFLINEGSFKFWAVFQLLTALVLIYSAFAAVYYTKYSFVQADYDYGDYFFGRSDDGAPATSKPWAGLNSQTFQRILDAISSKKYS